MNRVVLGPFNRVEGDLEVILDVGDGEVREARVNAPLFRGFELLLAGRPAADALVVAPRICGICSVAQSAAAAAALADAAGIAPAANGLLVRHLVQATENLADHLTHFYLFFMPDFARQDYAARPWHAAVAGRFGALRGSAGSEVLAARAGLLRAMGFLAGRWPHTLALQPGGSTRAVGAGERVRLLALLREFRAFLERRLFGDTLEAVAALGSRGALLDWAAGRDADFPAFVAAALDLGLDRAGDAGVPFLSCGAYGLFPAGVWDAGAAQSFDPGDIAEDTASSWLADAGPHHPAAGDTLPVADKAAAYTWCKAPRLAGAACEVGALARQVVAGHPLAHDLVAGGGNVLARVACRMLELAQVLPEMEAWVRALLPGEPFCAVAGLPEEGVGAGLVEAARGSLGHWLGIRRGRIEHYQIVAPTTWNFSPRDGAGRPGPLERALVGLPAGDGMPPTVQHVVRSFDPCMACTVH